LGTAADGIIPKFGTDRIDGSIEGVIVCRFAEQAKLRWFLTGSRKITRANTKESYLPIQGELFEQGFR
jgi:hypothetical protein